jgi:DNA-binding transcriptional MerR regulator
MPYDKQDLIARSGLADRTIRNYIGRGLIPPPVGHGPAAVYDDEHMARAVTIGRMRAEGTPIEVITQRIDGWSLAKFKRYVAQTNPPEASPPPEPAPEATAPPPPRPGNRDGGRAELETQEPVLDLALPAGPSFRILPLLPGLGLILDASASRIVQRVAAEIFDRYGGR